MRRAWGDSSWLTDVVSLAPTPPQKRWPPDTILLRIHRTESDQPYHRHFVLSKDWPRCAEGSLLVSTKSCVTVTEFHLIAHSISPVHVRLRRWPLCNGDTRKDAAYNYPENSACLEREGVSARSKGFSTITQALVSGGIESLQNSLEVF